MADTRKTTGAMGERETLEYLESLGYRIVDTNVRPLPGMARGEIDVIAWDGEFLVFCEVKTRRTALGQQGSPAEAVDARKQKQLTRLALAYLAKHALDDVNCRFDVVEVVRQPSRPPSIKLLRDAFRPAPLVY
jgi:putative endonuclease